MSAQFPSLSILSVRTDSFHQQAIAPLTESSSSSLPFPILPLPQANATPLTGRITSSSTLSTSSSTLSTRRKLFGSTTPSLIPKPQKTKSPFIQKAESILDTKTITREDRTVKLVPFSKGQFSEIFTVEGEAPLITERPNEQIVIRIYKKEHLQYSNAKIEGFLNAQLNNYYELSLLQIPSPYIYNLSTYKEDGYFIVYFISDPFPFPQKGASAQEIKKVKKEFRAFQEQIRKILATCYAYGVTADAKADNFRVGWTQDLQPVATLCDWMEYAEDFDLHLTKPVLPSFDFIEDPTLDPRILPHQTFNQIPEIEALTTQIVDAFLGEILPLSPPLKIEEEEEEKEWKPVKPMPKGIPQLKKQMIEQAKNSENLEKSFVEAVEELQEEAGLKDIDLLTLRNLKRFQKELALAFRSIDLEDLQSSLENLKVYLTDTEVRSLWDLFSQVIDSLDQKEKLFEKIVEFLSPQNESIRLYLAGKR